MRPGISTGPPSSQNFGQPTGTMPGMPPRYPSGQGMPGGMPPGSSQQNQPISGSQPMVRKQRQTSYVSVVVDCHYSIGLAHCSLMYVSKSCSVV